MADVQPSPHAPTHAGTLDPAPDPALDPAGATSGPSPVPAGPPVPAEPHGAAGRRSRSAAVHRGLALALAAAFLAAGLAGWAVTAGMPWTGHDPGRTLAGFTVNPLHNAVHLAVGAAGLVLCRRPGGVRGYGLLLALLYGAVLVYGLLAAGRPWDVLNLSPADNLLHLATVVLGLLVAAWPRPRPRPGPHGGRRLRRPAAGA